MKRTALIAMLFVFGCTHHSTPTNATGEALVRAATRGDSAYVHVNKARSFTAGDGRVHLETAADELLAQHNDISEARNDLKKERDQAQKEREAEAKFRNRFSVRIAVVIATFIKTILIVGTLLTIASYALAAFLPGGFLVGQLIHILPYAGLVRRVFKGGS